MNWQRAKTVLLIALLLTDIFLAGVLVADRMRIASQENTSDFHRETVRILKDNGITFDAEIPKEGTELPVLDVQFETDSSENWNERFFGGRGDIVDNQEQMLVIKGGHATLNVTDKRHILYESEGTSNRELKKSEAEALAKSFLKKRGFSTDDMRLVRGERKGNRWKLVYTCLYDDDYIESTYTEFEMVGDAVVKMDRLWIDVVAETDESQPLPLASQSLFRLLSHESLKGRTIKKIDPCYYFNPAEQATVGNLFHATRGYTTVAWRMVLDDGEELVLLH
ncbi:MAG: two-component system regulatory protein YycI [Peptoniphilus sp.]|nr:two-component system regulatory protein YycI [Peptoniphilus sp.]MDY6045163.1 two-component system regulatory protein YycI [Peptoniphilus sp.]